MRMASAALTARSRSQIRLLPATATPANDKDLENTLFSPVNFVSQGHNLIGNVDGVTGFNGVGDQIGTTAAPLNPHLAPLADNGGLTLTHALLSNSTALDAGSNALANDPNVPLETDQRGAGRIADSLDPDSLAVVDIGAFEFHQTLEDISNQTTPEDTPITITLALGDDGPAVTSVTATSNNQALVPNANLVLSGPRRRPDACKLLRQLINQDWR